MGAESLASRGPASFRFLGKPRPCGPDRCGENGEAAAPKGSTPHLCLRGTTCKPFHRGISQVPSNVALTSSFVCVSLCCIWDTWGTGWTRMEVELGSALQVAGANQVTCFVSAFWAVPERDKRGLGWSPVFCENFRLGDQGGGDLLTSF